MAACGNQLDYVGVVVLIWGATVPTVYYGFCDNPQLQKLYWTIVSIHDLLAPCIIEDHNLIRNVSLGLMFFYHLCYGHATSLLPKALFPALSCNDVRRFRAFCPHFHPTWLIPLRMACPESSYEFAMDASYGLSESHRRGDLCSKGRHLSSTVMLCSETIGSREIPSCCPRPLWEQSPNTTLHGHLRWVSPHDWAIPRIRLCQGSLTAIQTASFPETRARKRSTERNESRWPVGSARSQWCAESILHFSTVAS